LRYTVLLYSYKHGKSIFWGAEEGLVFVGCSVIEFLNWL
jgi:hypothetical protein